MTLVSIKGWFFAVEEGGVGDVTPGLLRVLSRPGGCKTQPRAANSCKEFVDELSRPVVVRVPAIYPEQGAPLTTIYREPRCVINSSARARNFKTFRGCILLRSTPSVSSLSPPPLDIFLCL